VAEWTQFNSRNRPSRFIVAKATTPNIDREFAANGDSFGLMGSFPPSNRGDQNAQRRSQRVIEKASVMVLVRTARWGTRYA